MLDRLPVVFLGLKDPLGQGLAVRADGDLDQVVAALAAPGHVVVAGHDGVPLLLVKRRGGFEVLARCLAHVLLGVAQELPGGRAGVDQRQRRFA